VAADRRARILAHLMAAGDGMSASRPLCEAATELVGVTGAGVMVVTDGLPQASLCASGPVSALIDELQFTFGEGPCVDAYETGKVIAEPDLAAPAVPRWPVFSSKALDAGVRAIFGFPIRIGAARIGALNLYRDRPGRLSDDQHADALVIADVVARTLLALQAHAEPGTIPSELDTDFHTAVHQAAGMISIQLGTSVGDALVRLRAYAFRSDRPIVDVARDVIDGTLHFEGLDEG
jgi:GAF domain-containing protein